MIHLTSESRASRAGMTKTEPTHLFPLKVGVVIQMKIGLRRVRPHGCKWRSIFVTHSAA